jgi:hypothetical protein
MNPTTRIAASTAPAELLERITREHFPQHPISAQPRGGVAASYLHARLTSAFEPVGRAAGGIIGHRGLLRLTDSRSAGAAASASALDHAGAGGAGNDAIVQLDRLYRTLHALNYFFGEARDDLLFLDVDRRLLTAVRADHGAYFESILSAIGVEPSRVAIVLPPQAPDDPVTFVRAAISYRIRGYRVLARLRNDAETDLAHVFLADPHYVAFEPTITAPTRGGLRAVEALTRRGIERLTFASSGAGP